MDFYDKLITSIVLIVVTFLCVFNTFCFADSEFFLEPTLVPDVSFYQTIHSAEGIESVVFFPLDHNTDYSFKTTFIQPQWEGGLYLSYSLDDGTRTLSLLDRIESFDFNSKDYNYFAVSSKHINDIDLSVFSLSYVVPSSGISTAVDSLVQNVGITNIWDTFELSLPYVLIVVVVGFGFYMILSLVRKLQKGKARL